jgi:hypothetical protein
MYLKNGSISDLEEALKIVNKKYDNNIIFKRIEKQSKQVIFTLTVKNSKNKGSSFNPATGRRKAAACWHVHGDFFDTLLEINNDVIIKTMISTIDKNGGNWVNYIMNGHYYSECCECKQ